MIDLGITGKRALVSGAGFIPTRAGHGRMTALRLAEAGAQLACVDIDPGRAGAIVDELVEAGAKAFPVIADMTDPGEVDHAIAAATEQLGGIDICVNIVGSATWDHGVNVLDDDWDRTIRNNLSQVFYLLRAAGRQMIAQATGGSLVSLASVDGTTAAIHHSPYGAAKAGVISLTKTFADELGRHGIRVNAVAPGNVGGGADANLTEDFGSNPVNPLAKPRAIDIANAVLFLSSDLAARITGQTLVVDGGASIKSLWDMTDQVPGRSGTVVPSYGRTGLTITPGG